MCRFAYPLTDDSERSIGMQCTVWIVHLPRGIVSGRTNPDMPLLLNGIIEFRHQPTYLGVEVKHYTTVVILACDLVGAETAMEFPMRIDGLQVEPRLQNRARHENEE